MPGRNTGLIVGKDFRPPAGAEPLEWCYLTVDTSDDERISFRIKRIHVNRAHIGDVVVFKRPRDADHPVRGLRRVASDPSLLPPVESSSDQD